MSESTESESPVDLRDGDSPSPAGPVLGASDVKDAPNSLGLGIYIISARNGGIEGIDDVLVDLIRDADQEVPGAAELIGKHLISWLKRNPGAQIKLCLVPSQPGDVEEIRHQAINMIDPVLLPGAQGVGIWRESPTCEAGEDCQLHGCQPGCQGH